MTRTTFNSSSPPPVSGPDLLDNLADHIKRLYDAAAFPLSAVGGTANAVTATLSPVLDGSGLVNGMRFGITWTASNTGAATLAINGGAAVAILSASGAALVGGEMASGSRALLEYVGASFRILTGSGSAGGLAPYTATITTSQTWNKPGGYDDETEVIFEAWGGGGAGFVGATPCGGGGGGSYVIRRMRYADVPSSLTVTIAAGGVGSGANGGNTTIGALVTAYGGEGGKTSNTGGKGGGELQSGASGGLVGGGKTSGDRAETDGGGGAGGGSGSNLPGGSAVNGAGGGGSGAGTGSAGGSSLRGGNGGNGGSSATGLAGTAPGGGGGGGSTTAGSGARGEVRIRIG
jgi:hypothetical protein